MTVAREKEIGPALWPGFLKTLPPLRNATYVVFFAAGAVSALWAGLIPTLKTTLGVDEAVLGTMILGLGIGSLCMMPLTGKMVARWGCRAVLRASVPLLALAVTMLAFLEHFWLAVALILCFGGSLGVTDVTMNIQSVVAEKREKKAILSSFHAAYSFGGMAGGLLFAALVGLGLPVSAVVTIGALLFAGACALWNPWSLGPGETEEPNPAAEKSSEGNPEGKTDGSSASSKPSGGKPALLYITAFFCFVFFLTEGSLLDWSALFLRDLKAADTAAAALGYSVFSAAMTIGRTLGDRVIVSIGRRRVFLTGTLCAVAAYAALLFLPGLWAAYAALFLMGIGLSNLVPIAFWLAGNCPGVSVSQGLSFVVSTGYAGILAGPAVIGFIARHTGLDAAFGLVAVLTLVVFTVSLRMFPPDDPK